MIDRYTKSFLLSLFLYSTLIAGFFIATSNFEKKSTENVISVSVFHEKQPQSTTCMAPASNAKQPPKPPKKTEELKNLSKQITTVNKSPITKSRQQQTIEQKPSTDLSTSIQNRSASSISNAKSSFLAHVKSAINSNKHYPNTAKDRGIEGSISAEFTITKSGDVSNIVIASGNNILKDATRKAIERSFPVTIPAELSDILPITENITLNFNLIKE